MSNKYLEKIAEFEGYKPRNRQKRKNSIKIKPSHRGELHEELNEPKKKKIPVRTLVDLAEHAHGKLKRQAEFAINARKWKHK